MNPTSIYRAIMLECERQRYARKLSMWQVDDLAGTQDGYYAKAVHADAMQGRQASWPILQLIVTALFPNGFDVMLMAKPGAQIETVEQFKAKVSALRAHHDGLAQRDRMRILGRKGGAQSSIVRRAKAEKREAQKARGRHAARIRWHNRKAPQSRGNSAQ